jgi:hypothetical protein
VDRRREIEIVTAYTDSLLGLQPRPQGGLSREDRVWGLLELAGHLHSLLVPVKPDTDFRRRLHGELILEAQACDLAPAGGLLRQHRKGILVGALLGSIASVAGLAIALFLRQRHGGGGHTAAA